MFRTMIAVLFCTTLLACAGPGNLRQPDDTMRVPINTTMPPELQDGERK